MEDPQDRSYQPPKEQELGTELKGTVTQLRTPRNLWNKKRDDKEGPLEVRQCQEKNGHKRSDNIKEAEVSGDLLAEVSNRSQSLVTSFATSNIAMELQFRNKPGRLVDGTRIN